VEVLLLATGDLPVRRKLQRLAQDAGLAVTDDEPGTPPAVAVIDLARPGALERVRDWRARWPAALLAGYLAAPDRERWVAAQRAGCDLVSNQGALALRLRAMLVDGRGRRVRSFPLFDAADAAGKLGLVMRVADTPVGPVAVYRAGGRLYAIADRCPHAGAALSGGEASDGVITCPGHGSQFSIRTGERLRGPADTAVAVFPLTEEEGQVCLLIKGA
jgi:nitrite reductase/ring-hydroxylating ferredoxin subunit